LISTIRAAPVGAVLAYRYALVIVQANGTMNDGAELVPVAIVDVIDHVTVGLCSPEYPEVPLYPDVPTPEYPEVPTPL
jgi:hypothetical protein